MGVFEKLKVWRGMGDLMNTGAGGALMDRVGSLVGAAAAMGPGVKLDGPPPWTPLSKPLSSARGTLITTAGLHLPGDEPFDVDAAEGDPSFREIPSSCDPRSLQVSHTHYSRQRFDRDPNVLFPLEHLRGLVQHGALGELGPRCFSFGFGWYLSEPYIERPDGTAHQVARRLLKDEVDFALLVPA